MKHYHIISRISIYSLAALLIVFGVFHFVRPHDLVLYYPMSIFGNIMWTYFVGAAFIVVGISFITNKLVKFTGYILAVLLFIFVFAIHLPNALNAGDKEMRVWAFLNLLKDASIAFFALHIAAGARHQHLHLGGSD